MKSFLSWEPQIEMPLKDKMDMSSTSHHSYYVNLPQDGYSWPSLDKNLHSDYNFINNRLELETDASDGLDSGCSRDDWFNPHSVNVSNGMMANIPCKPDVDWSAQKYLANTRSETTEDYLHSDVSVRELMERNVGQLDVGLKNPEQLTAVNLCGGRVKPQIILEDENHLNSSTVSVASASNDEEYEDNDLEPTEVPEFVMADYCMEYLKVTDRNKTFQRSRRCENDWGIQNDTVVSEKSGIGDDFFRESLEDVDVRDNDPGFKINLLPEDAGVQLFPEAVCFRQDLKESLVKLTELKCGSGLDGCVRKDGHDDMNGQSLATLSSVSPLSSVDGCEVSREEANGISWTNIEKGGVNSGVDNKDENGRDDNVKKSSAVCELIGVTCNKIDTKTPCDDFGEERETEKLTALVQGAEILNTDKKNISDTLAITSSQIISPASDNIMNDITDDNTDDELYSEIYGGQESDSDEVLSEDELTSISAMNICPAVAAGIFQKSYNVLHRNRAREFLRTVKVFHSYSDGTEV